MTTVTLTGFLIANDSNDDPISVSPATFAADVPDPSAVINYSLLPTPPGELLPLVDIGGTPMASASVNGTDVLNDDSLETSIGFIETPAGIHIILAIFDPDTNTDAIFQIGGDPLTEPTTVAEFNSLEASIINAGTASGDFGPGEDILLGLEGSFSGDPFNLVEGSDGNDTLVGTDADDLVVTGDTDANGDFYVASTGNDTIDMSDMNQSTAWFVMDYGVLGGPINVQIDGAANTGSVDAGADGTDTLLDVENPLNAGWIAGGLSIQGTAAADTFDVSPEGQQWMSIRPGDGLDTINVDGTGLVRLQMDDGNGIDVNLATRTINDDGFGNAEIIGGTAPVWEVMGSAGDDTFTGSGNGESFRPTGGDDTLDGGLGFDRLRYDSFQIASVTIDASAGTATGTLTAGGTFTDSISGFERLRGSGGNDQITGEAGVDNRYEGRGGTDTFVHLGGNDRIDDFDPTTETLIVRVAGLDQAAVDTAMSTGVAQGGDTLVTFGGGTVLFKGLAPVDLAGANVQAVDLDAASLVEGTDDDNVLNGTPGDDVILTGNATSVLGDVVNGSTGDDTIDMSGNDGVNGFVTIDYSAVTGPATITVDGASNIATVDKGVNGTDTLVGVAQPLSAGWVNGGLAIFGTAQGDTFNLAPEGNQWMSVRGGDGIDSYNINGSGLVRMDFRDATQGIDVNLATGAIADDGFGNEETITGTTPVHEIRGSGFDDTVTFSDAGASYRYESGSNTLIGGAGSDRVRYDVGQVQRVEADLSAGQVRVVTDSGTFTDTVNSIDSLRGSDGGDLMIADGSGVRLEGRGGDDTLVGGLGNDNVVLGSGSNTYVYRGGFDQVSDFDPLTDTLFIDLPGLTQQDVDDAFAAPIPFTDPFGDFFFLVDFGSQSGNLALRGLSEAQIQAIPAQLGDAGVSQIGNTIGTDGDDDLVGTGADDSITTGDNPGGDFVLGTAGDDTIDFTGITSDPGGFVTVDYSGIGTTIDVQVDGGANTGSVAKDGLGTDTFTNVELPLLAGWTTGGLSLLGTSGADTFDVAIEGQQWMSFRPGDGTDTITVGGDPSLIRLDMSDGNGINVDLSLASNQIIDDGFGNTETIGGTAPVWEVFGSGGNDDFTGSANAESFRPTGGDDTLDGGAGFDRLRYDSFQIASVNIDVSEGTATGTLTAGGTFTDSISGFERLRGSDGSDQITGEAGVDNRYEGEGGTDTFTHLGGNDTISDFDPNSETLIVRVAGLDQTAVDAAVSGAVAQGGDTLVTFGTGTVLFSGLAPGDLAGADVQFVEPGGANLVQGTDNDDFLEGTVGNDLITTGDATPDGDVVVASAGDDTIDMTGMNPNTSFMGLRYSDLGSGIDVTIDGAANTGTVDKGALGIDTLLGVENPMFAGWTVGGLGLDGTDFDDTFNVTLDDLQWTSIRGGAGQDTYTINTSVGQRVDPNDDVGALRLDMRFGNGIDVNLATGAIADDGYGNIEQINGNAPIWEVWGSGGDDSFVGSDNAESYRYTGGNNDLDGGLGFDRLRYDSSGVASVVIDAAGGVVNGTFDGGGTFTDSISGFERLRGSGGNDQITGEAGVDNRYEGRGGTDTFVHLGGNDTISDFDPNSETLIVRVAGLDQTAVDAAVSGAVAQGGDTLVTFGTGTVLFSGLAPGDLAGADVQFVEPGTANLVQGTDNDDTLEGTAVDDLITTGDNPGFDLVLGSAGNDTIDFTGITSEPGGFVEIDYSALGGPISVAIDGGGNTGTIIKDGLGTDTLSDVQAPLLAGWTSGGLSIVGTAAGDTFDVSPEGEQWMSIRPGDGQDTIIVNSNGTERTDPFDPIGAVRLDMSDGNGIDVNLATGEIANDGFGNAETIGGTAPVWEVRGSGGDDTFLGSGNAESYRYTGGNNDLTGGLGFDRLRYDSFIESVDINAETGVVTGTFFGGGSFTDTISGFEHFRGTQGNDSFIGTGESELFEGGQGSDTITAGGGDDTLAGGEGDSTLNGGTGSDVFFVGNGRTVIEDFNAAEDALDFSFTELGLVGRNTALENAFDNGGETTVDLGNGGNLIFDSLTVGEVQALADPDAGTPPPPPPTPIAWTVGDPHLLTLDGVGYDFHAIGEFVLLRGTSGGSFSEFEIQSRMGPVLDDADQPLPNVSANIAIAARLGNGSEVMIDSADASPLSIDGGATTIADGDAIDVGSDLIVREGNMYSVIFAGADGTVGAGDARLNVIVREGYVDLSVQISADMAGQVEGLLGDGDGNPDNDIALADGTVLERPLAFEDLYGNDTGTNPNLRDDWRVTTGEQSLFIYDAGETLDGLYDPDAPGGGPTDGFTDEQVSTAQQAVTDAGLIPGTLAFENAVQDFLVAGDARFIESSSGEAAPTPENAGSAGALADGEQRITIDVSLVDRGDAALDDAVVNFSAAGGAPILGKADAGAGQYDISLGSNSPGGKVDAVRGYDDAMDPGIGVSDALNALRLAVGLDPSFGPASAMDFIAADVDQNGQVGVSDALDILRFAVGLETGNAPRWVFMDEGQDLSGVTADNVVFDTGAETGDPGQLGGPVELTGVLLGSVAEVLGSPAEA
ncbi:beta strand repeat-containing protein [Roseovarius ramblicola]|uniref:Beta strand repeat-containing protein n=1 Tax=Roseovarius ramblicola TaxID=2022336 RepID=A0ABV5I0Q6_9RHOB